MLHILKIDLVSNFGFKFGVTYIEIMFSKFWFQIWHDLVSNFGFKFRIQICFNFGSNDIQFWFYFWVTNFVSIWLQNLYSNFGCKYWLKICDQ